MEATSETLLKQRAVIEFLYVEGVQNAAEIHRRLVNVYGTDTIDVSNVRRWVRKVSLSNRGEMSIRDEPRSGRPVTVTTVRNHDRVDAIIRENRRIKQWEIASMLGISKERVQEMIRDLKYRKICARWVPRQLTEEMKKKRVDMARELLNRIRKEGDQFLRNIVTGDETWVHHYDPEGKRASMEFRHPSSPRVRKFKTQSSAGKVMLTTFWDSEGIVYTEYLPKGTTVNSNRYCETLQKLKARIRRIRPNRIVFLLHHDNARPHCSHQTIEKIQRLKFELINHAPYSPDLAPSDFHLFPKMKEDLRGVRFASDEDVKNAVAEWLRKKDKEFFSTGFDKWVQRLQKCIDVAGDYVEK